LGPRYVFLNKLAGYHALLKRNFQIKARGVRLRLWVSPAGRQADGVSRSTREGRNPPGRDLTGSERGRLLQRNIYVVATKGRSREP